MYADLATIASDYDWVRLNRVLSSQGVTEPFWIGLYHDIQSWRWSLDEVPLANTVFTNWGPGDPDNNYGYESCGIINYAGQWWDAYCFDIRPFICFNGNISGAGRFIGVTSPMLTWSEARAYCRQLHTDLATVTNSAENDLLMQLASQMSSICYWTGLYRDTWKWSDGTKTLNLNWTTGQPNNLYRNEDCGMHSGLFQDDKCSNLRMFMCHTIPPVRERQTIRLHVKSDGSVLDPAVQLSILDRIKQKLEENRVLMNTTLTWKVQPYRKKVDDP
ncbi:E-selectin [Bagarius yarrelli]|uniref:E-selectin n=1 Tax=Bagarius yarrelli TaxID=175774 RepID=A0A556VUR4_BAGYA|nr:E-selectin [Bagarius yarrelli]